MAKSTGLGKGLGALIPQKPTKKAEPTTKEEKTVAKPSAPKKVVVTQAPTEFKVADDKNTVHQLPLAEVEADPDQPRKHFDHGALEELMSSVKIHGIIQPLVVTPKGKDGKHIVIAGERRLRAATMLGLKTVPAIIRDAKEQERLEIAIIENVQRSNFNPIEEAKAYERLVSEFNLTQQEVAKQVGKRRPTVANYLRMLELPNDVQDAVSDGKISAGHAKILAGLETPTEQEAFLKRILKQKLSVRDLEQVTKKKRAKKVGEAGRFDPVREAQEEMLRERFATRVDIKKTGDKGQIVLHFYSMEELQRLLNDLT